MKARMSIRNIILVVAVIYLASTFFINICFAANTAKISVETVRLREQPNTNSKVLELISIGEDVEILSEENEWYKVKYKKITGYVRKDLMKDENKPENTTTETTNEVIEEPVVEQPKVEENKPEETVTQQPKVEETGVKKGKYESTANAKLKIIPLISAIDVCEVAQGTEIEVTDVLNNWIKIKTTDGKEGWTINQRTINGERVVLLGLTKTSPGVTQEPEKQPTTEQQPEQQPEKQPEKQPEQPQESVKQPEVTTKTMYINTQVANVRKEPSTSSKKIKQLSLNTEVKVISTENGWACIEIDGGKAYISESLLSNTKKETSRGGTTTRNPQTTENTTEQPTQTQTQTNATQKEETKTEAQPTPTTTPAASSKGEEVVAYAKKFLGYKYVYGGTTTKGFDCSGFTQYVYKNFGVSLSRTAAAQYSNGTSVSNLQAGDLVMFGKSGINHVGIYIGGNTFIHAANAKRGVTTDTLASGYYKTNYVGARRVF